MLLDASDRSLEAIVATVISATDVFITAEYEDTNKEAVTPVTVVKDFIAETKEVVAAPAANTARRIIELYIYNSDNVSHDVIIQIKIAGVPQVLKKHTITAGKTLLYNRFFGWVLL